MNEPDELERSLNFVELMGVLALAMLKAINEPIPITDPREGDAHVVLNMMSSLAGRVGVNGRMLGRLAADYVKYRAGG